jgi:hypothetical protein
MGDLKAGSKTTRNKRQKRSVGEVVFWNVRRGLEHLYAFFSFFFFFFFFCLLLSFNFSQLTDATTAHCFLEAKESERPCAFPQAVKVMGFTKTSSRLANSRRKRRFPKEGRKDEVVVYRELTERLQMERERRERIREQINELLRKWCNDPVSGGTNNAISCAGVSTVVQKLNKLSRLSLSSVFVDLGCNSLN